MAWLIGAVSLQASHLNVATGILPSAATSLFSSNLSLQQDVSLPGVFETIELFIGFKVSCVVKNEKRAALTDVNIKSFRQRSPKKDPRRSKLSQQKKFAN